ncbi:MAG: sporulation integral membrane protein YtvI [Limnochordia bacterium]|jgi:sporulation integral membrane protein YtvI
MRRQERATLYWLGGILLLIYVLPVIVPLITPFLLAFLFASIIDPFVDDLERLGMPRGAAVLTVCCCLALILGLGLLGGYLHLSQEIRGLLESLPPGEDWATRLMEAWNIHWQRWFRHLPAPLGASLSQAMGGMSGIIEGLLWEGWNFLGNLPGFLATAAVALIASYFISRDKYLITQLIKRSTPKGWHHKLIIVRDELLTGVMGIIRAQVLLLTISTGMMIMGLNLLGLPYAGLIGLLAGFFDLLPVIGPGLILGPVALYYFIEENMIRALGILVLLGMVFLSRQLAEPRIMSHYVGIHPLAILIGIYAGVRLLGFEGLLLGPLLIIILRALFSAQNGLDWRL